MNSRMLRSVSITLGFIVLAGGTAGCDVIEDILGGLADVCEQSELVVTKPDDTNDGICTADDCSLREAVITSNDCPGAQIIRIPSGVYNLTLTGEGEDMSRTGDLDIRDDVIIIGQLFEGEGVPSGEEATIIDGQAEDRIFDIQPARDLDRATPLEVAIDNLWIRNGQADRGGAVLNRGNMSMVRTHFLDNRAVLSAGTGGVSQGGSLLSQDNGDVYLDTVYFGPSSADEGGAIYMHSGQLHWRLGEASGNTASQDGGALFVRYGAQVTLAEIDFRENEAGSDGGAIYNEGELEGAVILMAANEVNDRGGGLFNYSLAEAWFDNSWITNNNADIGGGAYNAGLLRIYRTGINNNTAFADQGGGIANVRDPLTPDGEAGASLWLENVTVSGNMLTSSAGSGGAGILNQEGNLQIVFSTLAYNSPDGIMSSGGGEVGIRSTILAYHAGGNCSGLSGVSGGYNIDDGTTCGFGATSDQTNTDPLLLRLAAFGFSGLMHPLDPNSPAIDKGDPDRCVATDQRWVARPQGPRCDVGAFEFDSEGVETPPEPGEEEESAEEETQPISVNFNADAYSILEGQCTKLRWEVINAELITLDGEQVESLAAQDVCPTTTTTYQLNATNAAEEVERFVNIEVAAGETIPEAPGNLNLGSVVCNAQEYMVPLNWTDLSDNEEGYRVYRDGALIATLGPDAKNFVDSPPYGGPYTYGVEAFNSAGASNRPTVQEGGCIY